MECYHCKGKLKWGKTPYSINRQSYHVVLDEIPAWICQQCGEPFFESHALKKIQEIIKILDSQIKTLSESTPVET